MKIISITVAVLAVAIATVQAAPVSKRDLIHARIDHNAVCVKVPVNVKAEDIDVLSKRDL
ncbi:hypothetical protein BGZ47_007499, partial [Haplosporangium gracile]